MQATIYSYSVLYSSSSGFQDKTPYAVAVLELEDGTRFSSMLQGWTPSKEIEIGRKVRQTGSDEAGRPLYSL